MVWASSEYADVNAKTFQCQEYDVLAELMLNVIKTSENAIKSYGVNVANIEETSKRMQEWVEQDGERAVPNLTSDAVVRNFDIIARVDEMGDQDVFSGMTFWI